MIDCFVWLLMQNSFMCPSVQTFRGNLAILPLYFKELLAYLRSWILIKNQIVINSTSAHHKLT
jgi:hypothetical protein